MRATNLTPKLVPLVSFRIPLACLEEILFFQKQRVGSASTTTSRFRSTVVPQRLRIAVEVSAPTSVAVQLGDRTVASVQMLFKGGDGCQFFAPAVGVPSGIELVKDAGEVLCVTSIFGRSWFISSVIGTIVGFLSIVSVVISIILSQSFAEGCVACLPLQSP